MKLNQMMSCNADYREKIAFLHKHKIRGRNLVEKLKKHLAAQQSTMEELHERLSVAFTRRCSGMWEKCVLLELSL